MMTIMMMKMMMMMITVVKVKNYRWENCRLRAGFMIVLVGPAAVVTGSRG